VLAHVHKQPGITIADLAKRMKIKPNYLYRVLSHLEKDGKLPKRDKGYHSTES
jgi:DNA-binding IscR family transcriptional regulator